MRSGPAPACGLALLCVVACQDAAPAPARQTAGPADRLVGLWKARRWFGPFARGSVVIRRTAAGMTADMVGRTVPVRVEGNALAFALPDQQGSFRGLLRPDGGPSGHWLAPRSLTQGMVHASPIDLAPDGADQWSGQVAPVEDAFTFYLAVRRRPDGSLGAFLRNPERNDGRRLGADHVILTGNAVKLIASDERGGEEVASGTYNPERDDLTLTVAGRGLYEFRRDGDESDFYPRGKNPGRYAYSPPLARDDGWPTGSLDQVDIDRPAIERFIQKMLDMPIESVETPELHAVLIARHGTLVLEEYFHGEHRDKLHDTRSAAKSVVATLVGAAMFAGAPVGPTTPVYSTMSGGSSADVEPHKRAMTLEHLLTMSSGYFCDDTNPDAPGNEDTMQSQEEEPDYYRYTLKVPMASAPGEKAVYCSADPNLALGVLSRAAGEPALDLFERLLAVPMGIRRYGWPLDPAGNPYGGGGAQFLPRDFMKFGQLMVNGGTWQGQRLVGRDFALRASSRLYHLRGIFYGYLWWSIDYPYKQRTVRAFFAGGNGGQGVTVVPQLDLVIATFGGNYSSRATIRIQQELSAIYILPAVREPGDDRTAPVAPREEYRSPYGKSPESGPVAPARRAGPLQSR
jgi:CubicO group peptidase (beta-lactamase class C family)